MLLYSGMRESCAKTLKVSIYFDIIGYVIFHWNEQSTERRVFKGKEKEMEGSDLKENNRGLESERVITMKQRGRLSLAPPPLHSVENRLPLGS